MNLSDNFSSIHLIKKRFFHTLMIISLIALFLRLVVSFQLKESYSAATTPKMGTDMYTYQELAKQIVNGSYDFSKGFYYQPFYYTVFLPLVYKVTGGFSWGIIVSQSFLGAATVLLVGLGFSRIFGRTVGLFAAIFTALDRYLIFYTPFTLIAVVQTFWISLLLFFSLLAYKSKRISLWTGVGLILGFSIITRGNVLLFLPIFPFLIYSSMRGFTKRFFLGMLVFFVGMVLPQLPFSIVNYCQGNGFIGSSSAGETVLALGNTPESPPGGRDAETGAGPMAYPESFKEWTKQAALKSKHRVSISSNIFSWIKEEPLAFFELKFRMFLLFWNRSEIPNNVALSTFGNKVKSTLLHSFFFLDFIFVGALGLAGMILSLIYHPRNKKILFTNALVIIYCLSTVLFYILARFRLPIVPLLCGFSAYSVVLFYRRLQGYFFKNHSGRNFWFIGLLFFTTFLFVHSGFDLYRMFWEKRVIRFVRPNGIQLRFPEKSIIKDHGPLPFGGWVHMPMKSVNHIEKTFVLKKQPSSPENVGLRFPVTCLSPATFSVVSTIDGANRSEVSEQIAVEPGFHWVEIKIGSEINLHKRNSIKISLELTPLDEGLSIFFDSQRFYGRTVVDDKEDFDLGEMVVELVSRSISPPSSL